MYKTANLILLIFCTLLCSSCDFVDRMRMSHRYGAKVSSNDSIFIEKKTQSSFLPLEFNEVSRLYYICKVWGFVKYYHENEDAIEKVDIDNVLLNAIKKNEVCRSKNEYQEIISELIASIQISPLEGISPYPNIEDYILINNSWMNDTIHLTPALSAKLNTLFTRHTGKKNNFIKNKSSTGEIVLLNEKIYEEAFPNIHTRLVGLFRYWNIINYFFVSKNYMDENWDQVLYESITRFKGTTSQKEYHLEFARLVNKLKDGHANIPTLEDEILLDQRIPNFKMIKICDTFLIQEILLPMNNVEGFRVGDVIMNINGHEVHQLYDSLSEFVGSGPFWARQEYIGYMMLSSHDSVMRHSIFRDTKDTLNITSKNLPLKEVNRLWRAKDKKEKQYRWLNDTIAYLDLRYLTRSNIQETLSPIQDAKVVVIDLRNYPDNSIFEKITDAFVPKTTTFCVVTYPDTRFPGMVRYTRNSVDLGSNDCFKGNVIVLVNERTGSFAEFLAMALQQNPRTITVGRSTAGSDGNVVRINFPGNIKTWHSGIGIYYPDMTQTQRVGVKIDCIVEPSVESINKQVDVSLEKAIEIAKNGM